MLEMVREAEYELLTYPQRNVGFHLKRTAKLLTDRGAAPIDKINWPNGLLAKSLADYYMGHKNSDEARDILDCMKKYYDRWI